MKTSAVLSLIFFLSAIFVSANCDTMYSSATYALNHAKKSMNSNNFDHQQYYAGKALESLQKTKRLLDECSCNKALYPILDGIENLEKALDPKDWNMGRYFTKKAFENTQNLLNELDSYTNTTSYTTSDSAVQEEENNANKEILLSALRELRKKQLKLAEEQNRLVAEQKVLESKINTLQP